MRKIIVLLLIIIIATPYGFAQEKEKAKKQKKILPSPIIEVWGGMGVSSVAGSLAIAEKRLAGLFGAGFTMPISHQNNIHFEAAYTFQGFKYKPQTYKLNDTTEINLEKAEQRFNYFKLTVMDKYFLDKKRTYYVNGGFYLAYLSQSRFQANGQLYADTEEEEHFEIDDGNKDVFKPFDFGLTAGIGLRLGNKEVSCFTIEIRAAYGLINVAKPDGDQKFNDKNFYGVLKLGIDIPVKN